MAQVYPEKRAEVMSQPSARTAAGLEPYRGPWNTRVAAHLLRRTTFGPTKSEVASAVSLSLDGTLARILQLQSVPAQPVDPATGQTWLGKPFDSAQDGKYQGYLKGWWMGLMAAQGMSIREKMTLFWHNHFVSEYQTVPDSRLMYRQNALFRSFALGNIRELVKAVTADPAMLIYLNGYRNRGDGNNVPDENYARELQELFTVGKGPQIGPGDYTNYTEQDVKAAAQVLTGWRVTGYHDSLKADIGSYFDPTWHDRKDKLFSSAYQNTRITGGVDGERELQDLVDMIFRQPETAKFLCRKLYRWFVYYEIDSLAEANVIAPLADIMRSSNYEISPVLEALFRSAHFFDDSNIGCLIRNPADMLAGSVRLLEIAVPSASSQAANYYSFMSYLVNSCANLQMNLMDPPNVAGWPAYYEAPEFHRLWINTITLPSRWGITDALVNSIRVGTTRVAVDGIALAKQASNPEDPVSLVNEFAQRMFAVEITATQREYLIRNVLIPGLPDYEWTLYWLAYAGNPANSQNLNAVSTRINALLKFMMRMAEFELS